jgi:hypothetical protein
MVHPAAALAALNSRWFEFFEAQKLFFWRFPHRTRAVFA